MRFYTNTDLALRLQYRVDAAPTSTIRLGVGDGAIDLTPTLRAARVGEWRDVKVKLKCFAAAGTDATAVTRPSTL